MIYAALERALPDLIRELRRQGYSAGIDQLISARILFGNWTQHGPVPKAILCASLSALFSTSARQQADFPDIFEHWFERWDLYPTEIVSPLLPELTESPGLMQFGKSHWRFKVVCGAAMVLVLCLVLVFIRLDNPDMDEQSNAANLSAAQGGSGEETPDIEQKPPDLWVPSPRLPAEVIRAPAKYRPDFGYPIQYALLLPIALWVFWLLSRLQLRYLVLKKNRVLDDKNSTPSFRLHTLRLKRYPADLFRVAAWKSVYKWWRRPKAFRSRRLNVAKTVQRTLNNGGFFQAAFRQRMLPADYVLLIDRRHRNDFVAEFAMEFCRVMREEGIFLSVYHYHAEPVLFWSYTSASEGVDLHGLVGRHSGNNLLIVGEAATLINSAVSYGDWQSSTLLAVNSPLEWGEAEIQLAQQGVCILPFSRRGLSELPEVTASFSEPEFIDGFRYIDVLDSPQPQAPGLSAHSWFDDRKLSAKRKKRFIRSLLHVLGYEGFELLAATAAYPSLDWQLTQALDVELALSPGESREIRLRSLARIPWFRRAAIPDHWRRVLLRTVDAGQLAKITRAYRNLQNYQGGVTHSLPVAVPISDLEAKEQSELLPMVSASDPGRDRVYASVICGRKPDLLEFTLFQQLDDWIVRKLKLERWRGLFASALLSFIPVVFIVSIMFFGWRIWADDWIENRAVENMREQLGKYSVQVVYRQPELEFTAKALTIILGTWNFTIKEPVLERISAPESLTSGEEESESPPNRIEFSGAVNRPVAKIVESCLRHLTWGAAPSILKYQDSENKDIKISLVEAWRPGSVFRDPLPANLSQRVFRDSLLDGGLGPAMVEVPAGCFSMGSNTDDTESYKDETPRHEVCIKKSFNIGRYEVTFDDYQKYIQANGLKLPNSQGWGKGHRPVINVSWEDATNYTKWLSKVTEKSYRLPTEAEWEFVARAGTKTHYWWADEIGSNKANCHGCGSLWDGRMTAPVGSFVPNGFGLFDTSGNVWEWVQDCWHDDYKDAPTDGSAWLDKDGADCGRRVIRGGSWNSRPRALRSADRNGGTADDRYSNVGFRLAQDLN